MPFKCKGICERLGLGLSRSHRDMYKNGGTFCKACHMPMPCPPEHVVRCLCCGSKLRFGPSQAAHAYQRRKFERRKQDYHKRKNAKAKIEDPQQPWAIVQDLRKRVMIAEQVQKEVTVISNVRL